MTAGLADPAPGDPVDERGRLVREHGAFVLLRDAGGRYLLDLIRVPVDEVEKHVRIVGVYAGDGRVEVDGVALA